MGDTHPGAPAADSAQPAAPPTIGGIFREYGPAYRRKCAARMSQEQLKVMDMLERCRTGALGSVLYRCDACQKDHPMPRSCGNRHCPQCQGHKAKQWLEAQLAKLLPCVYFLLTFTVPQELRRFVRAHPRACLAISNRRVVKCEPGPDGLGRVTFTYRPSGSRRYRAMTVTAEEFIRRFLQHVLPRGLQKVRHYGFAHPRSRIDLDIHRRRSATNCRPPKAPDRVAPRNAKPIWQVAYFLTLPRLPAARRGLLEPEIRWWLAFSPANLDFLNQSHCAQPRLLRSPHHLILH